MLRDTTGMQSTNSRLWETRSGILFSQKKYCIPEVLIHVTTWWNLDRKMPSEARCRRLHIM